MQNDRFYLSLSFHDHDHDDNPDVAYVLYDGSYQDLSGKLHEESVGFYIPLEDIDMLAARLLEEREKLLEQRKLKELLETHWGVIDQSIKDFFMANIIENGDPLVCLDDKKQVFYLDEGEYLALSFFETSIAAHKCYHLNESEENKQLLHSLIEETFLLALRRLIHEKEERARLLLEGKLLPVLTPQDVRKAILST